MLALVGCDPSRLDLSPTRNNPPSRNNRPRRKLVLLTVESTVSASRSLLVGASMSELGIPWSDVPGHVASVVRSDSALLLDDECFLAARHRRRWPRV